MTIGDLLVVEKPQPFFLEARQQVSTRCGIRASACQSGIILGHVFYEKKSAADKNFIYMNELNVDILEYLEKAWINELQFRTMWSEFEWENKININTSITEIADYLENIMLNTNMGIVGRPRTVQADSIQKGRMTKSEIDEQISATPSISKLLQETSFCAVNLYSRTTFGEDALANLSIEKTDAGTLTGSVRIRSRTQNVALSLGDRITAHQRSRVPN